MGYHGEGLLVRTSPETRGRGRRTWALLGLQLGAGRGLREWGCGCCCAAWGWPGGAAMGARPGPWLGFLLPCAASREREGSRLSCRCCWWRREKGIRVKGVWLRQVCALDLLPTGEGGAAGVGGRLLLLLERGRGLDLGLITRFRVRLTIEIR